MMEKRQQLKNRFVGNDLELIIVSDHGMMNVKPDHVFDYSMNLDKNTYAVAGNSPIFEIKPTHGKKT